MKIIGANGEKRIVRCDKDELAKITGHYWSGSSGCREMKCGTEIDVSGVYAQYNRLINNLKELSTIRKACEEIFASASKMNPIIERQREIKKE